jgi:cytochrome c553
LISQFSSEELLVQLLAYKTGNRSGTLMPQLTKGYTDAQLESIANQLGQKP